MAATIRREVPAFSGDKRIRINCEASLRAYFTKRISRAFKTRFSLRTLRILRFIFQRTLFEFRLFPNVFYLPVNKPFPCMVMSAK
jgi:hypothetical protein